MGLPTSELTDNGMPSVVEVDRAQWIGRRTRQDSAIDFKSRAVTRAVPACLCVVPLDGAPQVSAPCRNAVDGAFRVPISPLNKTSVPPAAWISLLIRHLSAWLDPLERQFHTGQITAFDVRRWALQRSNLRLRSALGHSYRPRASDQKEDRVPSSVPQLRTVI